MSKPAFDVDAALRGLVEKWVGQQFSGSFTSPAVQLGALRIELARRLDLYLDATWADILAAIDELKGRN